MKTPVITLPNEKNFTDSNIGCFILHDARSGAVQHDCQDTRKIQGRSLAGGYEKAGADNEEVCFDELGDVIDRAVESGTDKEEYDKFCDRQLAVLLSGTRA